MATRRTPPDRRTQSANDQLLDDLVRHLHDLEAIKNGLVAETLGALNARVYSKIIDLVRQLERVGVEDWRQTVRFRSPEFAKLLARMDSVITSGTLTVAAQTDAAMLTVGSLEAAWAVKAIRTAVPIPVQLNTIAPQLQKSIIRSRPFNGHLLKDWYGGLELKTRQVVRGAINDGITQGQSVDDMVRALKGTRANGYRDSVLQGTRRDAENVVRTATTHVTNHAREETFKDNVDVIKGVRFVATLDSRTTPECASLDGQVFPVGEGPRPPIHHSCRSATVPVLKSWKELGIDLKDLPEGTRASMNGQVPKSLTYFDWFKQQDAAFQREWLGPTRYGIWKKTGAPIEKFVNNGKLLTLDKLAEKVGT